MTPDKIYIPIIEDDKGGHPCTDWEDFPYPYAQNNIEYIRKDALLEWAKERLVKSYDGSTDFDYGMAYAYTCLIEKLEEL